MFFFTFLVLIIPPVYLVVFFEGPFPSNLCHPLPPSAED